MTANQIDIVRSIVKEFQPVRTEQVKIQAMYKGVSCADRYLRWLQDEGVVVSYKAKSEDRTKTWIVAPMVQDKDDIKKLQTAELDKKGCNTPEPIPNPAEQSPVQSVEPVAAIGKESQLELIK